MQWYPGENVGQGKDYTLFSTIEGIVIYQKRPDRDSVSTHPAAVLAVTVAVVAAAAAAAARNAAQLQGHGRLMSAAAPAASGPGVWSGSIQGQHMVGISLHLLAVRLVQGCGKQAGGGHQAASRIRQGMCMAHGPCGVGLHRARR